MATGSDIVYKVKPLRHGRVETVRASRLIPYSFSSQDLEVPEDMLRLADHSDSKYEVTESIIDIVEDPEGILCQIRRLGLPDTGDYIWAEHEHRGKAMELTVEEVPGPLRIAAHQGPASL